MDLPALDILLSEITVESILKTCNTCIMLKYNFTLKFHSPIPSSH